MENFPGLAAKSSFQIILRHLERPQQLGWWEHVTYEEIISQHPHRLGRRDHQFSTVAFRQLPSSFGIPVHPQNGPLEHPRGLGCWESGHAHTKKAVPSSSSSISGTSTESSGHASSVHEAHSYLKVLQENCLILCAYLLQHFLGNAVCLFEPSRAHGRSARTAFKRPASACLQMPGLALAAKSSFQIIPRHLERPQQLGWWEHVTYEEIISQHPHRLGRRDHQFSTVAFRQLPSSFGIPVHPQNGPLEHPRGLGCWELGHAHTKKAVPSSSSSISGRGAPSTESSGHASAQQTLPS